MGWWGSFAGFWIKYGQAFANAAIILSAIAAFLLIVTSIKSARKSSTLQTIIRNESDKDLIRAREIFIKIQEGNHKPEYYGAKEQRNTREAQAIRTVLNIHELIAVAINEGVIDERVYRRWYNRGFISDYNEMVGYIKAVRAWRQNPTIYKEFETLALRWEGDQSWYAPPSLLKRKYRAFRALWRA